jgi:hypothetical protein
LYLIYTADIPTTNETNMTTFADDTAILALDQNPIVASEKLQNHLNLLQQWLCKWKIKVNNNKSVQIMFTTKSTGCPPVMLNEPIPMKNEVKYLGLHLDRRLTWTTGSQMAVRLPALRSGRLSSPRKIHGTNFLLEL